MNYLTRFLAISVGAGGAVVIHAQSLSSPTSAERTTSETLQLSPFEVRTDKDVGYQANDTISAGRLSVNLLNTPADITVLTREFIDDIGAVDIYEASKWLTNSAVNEPFERDFGTAVTFRGLPSGANTRNYFQYFFSTEQYVTERLEGSRGPNSILYGDSTSGGQSNAITKRARPNSFSAVKGLVDSEGSRIVTADINRPLNDRLAVRANGLYQQQRSWMDHYFDNRYAGALAVTYRPWEGGEWRLDAETGYRDISTRTDFFIDRSSSWDGVTSVSAPLTANLPTTTGVSRITTDKVVVIPGIGTVSLRNFGQSSGTGLSIVDGVRPFANFPALPRKSFRILPNETRLGTHFYTASLFLEQTFKNGLVMELAGNTSMVKRDGNSFNQNTAFIDVNRVLPGGQTNPNFGKYYSETQLFSQNGSTDWTHALRVAAAYPIKMEKFSQILSIVGQYRNHVFDPTSYNLRRSNGQVASLRDANNVVFSWHYWDQPDIETIYPQNDSTYQYDYTVARDSRNEQRLESVQFNTVGQYFKNRVHLLGGFRFDKFKGTVRDATTWDAVGKSPTDYSWVETNTNVTSSSLGFVYYPIRAGGIYVNYSEGFLPSTPAFPSLDGSTGSNMTEAEAMGAGLRFNLFGGRLVGSAGYYKSREYNRPQNISTAQINQIWLDLNMPERRIVGGVFAQYVDTFETEGQGWEVDLTGNVTKSLRLKFNLALPENKQSNSAPASKAYLAANEAAWRAGANDLNNPNRARIASSLATYENTIRTLVDGRASNLTYDYRANVFGTYNFLSGSLKGLRLGGGANFYGKRIIGSPTAAPFDYVFTPAYCEASALVGYNFKLRNTPVEMQMNISNLFDYSDPVYSSLAVFQNTLYRNNYRYLGPRRAQLSTTIRF